MLPLHEHGILQVHNIVLYLPAPDALATQPPLGHLLEENLPEICHLVPRYDALVGYVSRYAVYALPHLRVRKQKYISSFATGNCQFVTRVQTRQVSRIGYRCNEKVQPTCVLHEASYR